MKGGFKKKMGTGKWEPLVTTEEFDKGIKILLKNGDNKSRFKRNHYLLRNLLWVKLSKQHYKMFGSTPSGRTQSYSYYITHTKINEKKLEFERRVIHARSHFSAFWNFSHMKYLPDQHLRLGWDHAPWDARGELYIKYGEPDIRSVEGWHTEEWIYYKYGVDFLVKQYITNIYGNAITGGELSHSRYGNDIFRRRDDSWIPYLQSEFIYKNEMKYDYNYNAEPIEDLQMEILTSESGITINYSLPSAELTWNKNISYLENMVIYNSDQREILRKSFDRIINEKIDEIKQIIEIELPAGEYNIAIKLKDNNSKKLGIYKSLVNVE